MEAEEAGPIGVCDGGGAQGPWRRAAGGVMSGCLMVLACVTAWMAMPSTDGRNQKIRQVWEDRNRRVSLQTCYWVPTRDETWRYKSEHQCAENITDGHGTIFLGRA